MKDKGNGLLVKQNWEPILFVLLLVASLFPVWSNSYFLTTDGPSHLYNAKVLLDHFLGRNPDLYQQFYELNLEPNPNWFSHIFLAAALLIFEGPTAEKILITCCIVSFVVGLRMSVSAVDRSNSAISIVGFLLVFNRPFQMGFFNYSLSIGLALVVFALWIGRLKAKNFTKWIWLSVAFLLLYFIHPFGVALCMLLISAITIASVVEGSATVENKIGSSVKQGMALFLSALPTLVLALWYVTSNAGAAIKPNQYSTKVLHHQFLESSSLISMMEADALPAIGVSILVALIVMYAIWSKFRSRRFSAMDVLLILFAGLLFLYYNSPGSLAGGSVLSERLQTLPFIIILIWASSARIVSAAKVAVALITVSLFCWQASIRFPRHRMASELMVEYQEVEADITHGSVVAPICFSLSGETTGGEPITDKIWLFAHAHNYLGVGSSVVFLDNYEANTGYFPLSWKPSVNPFKHFVGRWYLSEYPGKQSFFKYNDSVAKIDQVLLLGMEPGFLEDSTHLELSEFIRERCTLDRRSSNGAAILYSVN